MQGIALHCTTLHDGATPMSLPTKDSQVSLRLPGELKERIESYALMTGRSKSHVAMEALADYLDWRLPQVADLKQAIAAADRGEFASDAEVQSVLARYADPAAPPAATPAAAKPTRRRA
jgi:predicted transcriptional regulator